MANNNQSSAGHIQLDPFQSIRKVVEIFRKSIPGFVLSATSQNLEAEDALTQELFHQLQGNIGIAPYYFGPQNRENKTGNSPSNDMAAFSNQQRRDENGAIIPVLRFEAKRLSSELKKKRKKEYVIGDYSKPEKKPKNTGGIERFKNGTHGSRDKYAAIIGYLQTGNSQQWLEDINGWISDEIKNPSNSKLKWAKSDKLINHEHFKKHEEFISQSERIANGPILLNHFWINLL